MLDVVQDTATRYERFDNGCIPEMALFSKPDYVIVWVEVDELSPVGTLSEPRNDSRG
jgi:hypothetical protein